MITVMKAIIILLLQIIIYYLFGSLLELICRKKHGMVFKVISGFLTYQIIFHICALPMIKMDQTLTRLTILWLLIVAICCIWVGIRCRKRIMEDIGMVRNAFSGTKYGFCLWGYSYL